MSSLPVLRCLWQAMARYGGLQRHRSDGRADGHLSPRGDRHHRQRRARLLLGDGRRDRREQHRREKDVEDDSGQ